MEAPPVTPVSQRAARRARRAQAQAEGKCTATAKGSGKRCKNAPVEGRATCRKHGGTGGRKIVHGRYAEDLRGRLRGKFLASLGDETLLENAQTIALLDSLVREACERAMDLDTPAFRKLAVERVEFIEAILVEGKDPKLAVRALGELLRKGLDQVVAEDRLFRLGERLDARIAEANRIKLSKQSAIPATDLTNLMQAMFAAYQRLCAPELARQLVDEMGKICGGIDLAPPARETIVGRN